MSINNFIDHIGAGFAYGAAFGALSNLTGGMGFYGGFPPIFGFGYGFHCHHHHHHHPHHHHHFWLC